MLSRRPLPSGALVNFSLPVSPCDQCGGRAMRVIVCPKGGNGACGDRQDHALLADPGHDLLVVGKPVRERGAVVQNDPPGNAAFGQRLAVYLSSIGPPFSPFAAQRVSCASGWAAASTSWRFIAGISHSGWFSILSSVAARAGTST